ncbi:MAG: mycofactocin radical SAM maturase [Clostridia bacterium]|nr:mycofactocin radical SAM maturase [Clostridia bacterium]
MLKDNLHNIPLSAPVNVTWEITRRCNLNCKHCLSRDRMNDCASDMTFEECKQFVDDLLACSVFQVNIGGGEPFMREDIWDILAYCHENGMVTCVSTNGSLIDEKAAKRLTAMPLNYIQVSLDGYKKETNDAIRGDGTYDIAMGAIERFTAAGFPHLSINTVVTRVNFRELPYLYALAKKYHAKTRLSRFRPSGNAAAMWDKYHLTKEQTLELAKLLSEYHDIVTGDSFFSITAADRKHLGLNMCGAAKMTCSVSPDGNMYPCAFLQQDDFLVGNVKQEKFIDIWNNAPLLNEFRNLKPTSCGDCERFDTCHGGCPAIAYFLKNDIHAGDPACIVNMGK